MSWQAEVLKGCGKNPLAQAHATPPSLFTHSCGKSHMSSERDIDNFTIFWQYFLHEIVLNISFRESAAIRKKPAHFRKSPSSVKSILSERTGRVENENLSFSKSHVPKHAWKNTQYPECAKTFAKVFKRYLQK
jgi:hypothetical protein